MRDEDLRKNASGCSDYTAYEAIKNVDEYVEKRSTRIDNFIGDIYRLCKKHCFEIIGEIKIRDKQKHCIYTRKIRKDDY